jgi:hypothetical protein
MRGGQMAAKKQQKKRPWKAGGNRRLMFRPSVAVLDGRRSSGGIEAKKTGREKATAFFFEFKFVYIFSLRQAIHGLQTKETDDTCNLPIKYLSSGPQVAVKVAQERWQTIDNKKL